MMVPYGDDSWVDPGSVTDIWVSTDGSGEWKRWRVRFALSSGREYRHATYLEKVDAVAAAARLASGDFSDQGEDVYG